MKQANEFLYDILDLDTPQASSDILWRAGSPTSAHTDDGAVLLDVPFCAQRIEQATGGLALGDTKLLHIRPNKDVPSQSHRVMVRAYGGQIIRVTLALREAIPDDENAMLQWDPSLEAEPLTIREVSEGWEIVDGAQRKRMVVTIPGEDRQYANGLPACPDAFNVQLYPDGQVGVPFMTCDRFAEALDNSLSLAYVERERQPHRITFAVHAQPGESFAGTGERFAQMDLSGKTILVENADGMGVNNRRAYKNVPLYVSNRPYGLLILSSADIRLSLADISTRAVVGLVEDPLLDLFFFGGGSLERILYNYRRITGFPGNVPLWSFGTWMSRMAYSSAQQVLEVGEKLREGGFPCDVIHIDDAWFDEPFVCDWQFNRERFPDPEGLMRKMRDQNFRISLWQRPSLDAKNKLYDEAVNRGYAVPKEAINNETGRTERELPPAAIDFSNPAAVAWYQSLLEGPLQMGASVIKTDFGEEVSTNVDYHSLSGPLMHNLYALLYTKAAFEVTKRVTGEGITWARPAWVGSQRYPVHWGGDSASTWDGLAGSIRGGLHLGLSGFAFWSHDVGGFHGVPDFADSRPSDELYMRWTQVGVFSSHMRYHGAQPREPYEYPQIADLVRQWLRLRYCLIPYLAQQSERAVESGFPILRALVLQHQADQTCWAIDDQFYCGDTFLVAPVLSPEGVRDVYLPEGNWTDFWTGEVHNGPQWLHSVESPLARIPVYAVSGAAVPVYPEVVQSTAEMDPARITILSFGPEYRGLANSVLGQVVDL